MSDDETRKMYRCKHTVEAMRWFDTDAMREKFATWFHEHDCMFETRGPFIVMPEGGEAMPGEWILRMENDWVAMEDDIFRTEYAEAYP